MFIDLEDPVKLRTPLGVRCVELKLFDSRSRGIVVVFL